MISRLDRDTGLLMKQLKELGLDENTLVIFSSDNGTTHLDKEVDAEFFESVGPLRGLKGSLYEGGIRVPMIARWPGKIAPSTTTDHISGFYDVMPTIAEVVGHRASAGHRRNQLRPHLVRTAGAAAAARVPVLGVRRLRWPAGGADGRLEGRAPEHAAPQQSRPAENRTLQSARRHRRVA